MQSKRSQFPEPPTPDSDRASRQGQRSPSSSQPDFDSGAFRRVPPTPPSVPGAPSSDSERVIDSSRRGAPSSSTGRKKILIVDDSFTAIMMAQAILSKRAYQIITARDGREAIDKALQERPDLILMDVVMPNLNGFQACMRLRSMDSTKNIPIFLLTTRGEAESVAQGFSSGCTAYLSKPLDGAELLAKVKSYLGE